MITATYISNGGVVPQASVLCHLRALLLIVCICYLQRIALGSWSPFSLWALSDWEFAHTIPPAADDYQSGSTKAELLYLEVTQTTEGVTDAPELPMGLG